MGRRLSFQQYYQNQNQASGTLRSRISIDSLSSDHTKKNSSSDDDDLAAAGGSSKDYDTLSRNRGPRPAYSDANMQHSLGYLP